MMMMVHLITISDAAYDSLLPSYKYILDNLKEQASVWDEVAATAHNDDENRKKTVNPYKTLDKINNWKHGYTNFQYSGLTRASTI